MRDAFASAAADVDLGASARALITCGSSFCERQPILLQRSTHTFLDFDHETTSRFLYKQETEIKLRATHRAW